jgi:hypothetical protein
MMGKKKPELFRFHAFVFMILSGHGAVRLALLLSEA